MTDRIRGVVAQLLNQRELVINCGSDDGVSNGMTFAVLNRRGAEIRDPKTGEVLGSVELPKVLVRIVRTDERLAVARTFKTERRNVGGGGMGVSGIGRIFEPELYVDVAETLRLEDKTFAEEITERESYVKIGDPVV